MKEVYEFVDKNSGLFLEELREFIRKPGISTENTGIEESVSWLVTKMKENGVENVNIFQTQRHPIILGTVGKTAKRTLLVYGHYDIQPPGDRQEWMVDPFAAEVKENRIIGRGTCDMKNNLMACIQAVKALLLTKKNLPVNLIFLFEGEEEIGSPSLKQFIEEHRVELSICDSILCAEGGENKLGQPILNFGYKGWLYLELSVNSPSGIDVHSMYAGVTENPAWRLISLLRSLKEENKVLIPHFYDGVQEPSLTEKVKYGLARVVYSKAKFEKMNEVKLKKDMNVSEALLEAFFKPTLNISGLWSGYTVEKGIKTIVPGRASAKIDMRLVPGQVPLTIFENLQKYLASKGFSDVKIEKLIEGPAYRVDPHERIVQVVDQALSKVVGKKKMVVPIAPGSASVAWLPLILVKPMAFAGSGSYYLAHRPNEFITIEQYLKGIKLFATIYNNFSQR